MKYGIAIRNMGPQSTEGTIRACARTAEQLGYDSIVVSDHLCIPPDQTEGSGGRYLDVLASLAFIAGASTRIRLGVSVLVLPYRPAVLTAKQVATIQEKRLRGKQSDETLRVLRHLFMREAEAYSGELVNFPAFVFAPRPACPPIWVGGNGEAAIRRTVEFGDGWHPMLPAEKLKPALKELKERLRQAGRFDDIEVVVRRGLRFDDIHGAKAKVQAESEAGATYYILDLGRYADEKEFATKAETFFMKVAV